MVLILQIPHQKNIKISDEINSLTIWSFKIKVALNLQNLVFKFQESHVAYPFKKCHILFRNYKCGQSLFCARHGIIECLYVHFLDGVCTFAEQSNFHKIKLKGVNFDNPQQLILTDLPYMTSRIVINILKLTRKHWSLLVPKKLTHLVLLLLD